MNSFGLIASLVQSLAWPVAIILLALLFRDKLAAILDRVLEARYGKFAVKLRNVDQLLNAAKVELQPPTIEMRPAIDRQISAPPRGQRRIVASEPPEPLMVTEVKPRLLDGASSDPKNLDPGIQIELAWQKLTRNILAAARGAGLTRTRSLRAAIAHLVGRRLVPSAFEDAFANVKASYKAIQRNPGGEVDEALAQMANQLGC